MAQTLKPHQRYEPVSSRHVPDEAERTLACIHLYTNKLNTEDLVYT